MTATQAPSGPIAPAAPPPTRRGRFAGLHGIAYLGLLALTAVTYLVNLSVSGWANAFYSGAVRAMTQNWTAFFFGSADAGNTITVDKPPASLWVMAVSVKLFGLSSWSILVPEALMGVASVALLYAAVRRVAGPVAALVAGLVLALTPVAVLMFRFNNPDAAMVLLLVAAAYAVVRALEGASTRWLLAAGALIGLAFLTKTAAALLPLPALALAYLWAAPTGLGRRVRQLLGAGVAMVVSAGWWFVVAALWPAGKAPYIGGSTNGSAWQLALGYNGLGRLFGESTGGSVGTSSSTSTSGGFPGGGAGFPGGDFGGGGGGGGFGGFGSGTGLLRMFDSTVGAQVSWLLPAALILLVAGLVLTYRAPRTDPVRASLIVWGGWTLVTGGTFSFMEGTFHQYYTVALAPGIAATVGIGGAALWRRRQSMAARATLAVVVAVTGVWAWVLLGRASGFVPALRWIVLVVAVVAAVGLLGRGLRLAAGALTVGVVAASAGPAAFATQTVQTAYTSGIPLAGPASAASGGFGGGGFPGVSSGRTGKSSGTGGGMFGEGDNTVSAALVTLLKNAGTKWSAATSTTSSSAVYALASNTDVMGIGGFMGSDPAPTLAQFKKDVAAGEIHYYIVSSRGGFGGAPGGTSGGTSGATSGSGQGMTGAGGQLPEGLSAAQRKQLEEFMAGSGTGTAPGGASGEMMPGGFGGGRGASSSISTWVEGHFTATTVGGTTVYDLTKPKS